MKSKTTAHTYTKETEPQLQRKDWWLPEAGGGQNGCKGSKGTNFQLQGKFWVVMYSTETEGDNIVPDPKDSKRADFKRSHHKKNKCVTTVW